MLFKEYDGWIRVVLLFFGIVWWFRGLENNVESIAKQANANTVAIEQMIKTQTRMAADIARLDERTRKNGQPIRNENE